MANYTKSTDFAAKDSLSSGDSNKVVRGTEFETEFDAISTAIATKSDIASPTFTGTTTIPTVDINGGAIDGTTIGAASAGAGTFTNLTASTSFTLNGVAITSTAAELNILDGVTSTASELNLVDGSSAGTIVNSKAVIYGSSGEVNATTLQISGTAITSSAAELNILDGVTSTTAELNILDGVTSTTAELNVLDGVTSFLDEDDLSSNSATSLASQQSIKAYVDSQTGGGGATLSGLTDTNVTSPADAALLFYDTGTSKWIDNVVSGDITIADTGVAAIGSGVIVNADISGSAAIDISKLNGVTSTAAELNLVDGSTADTVVNSKAVIYGAAGQITANELDVDNIQLDANAIKSTDTNGNIQLFPNGTGFTELYGNTNAGTIRFNCESNYHGVTVQGPAHSAAATYTVKLPDTLGLTQASGLVTSDSDGVVKFNDGISEKLETLSGTSVTIDLHTSTNFTHTLSGTTSYTFSNPEGSGYVSAFTLKVIQDSSASGYAITWPSDVDWAGGTAPTLTATANAVDIFVFYTNDGGTTYYGFVAGQALA
jgi:hypothetical protein